MILPRPGVLTGAAAGAVLVMVLVTSFVSPGTAASSSGPGSGSTVTTSQPITSADLVCLVPATAKGVSQATISAGAAGAAGGNGTPNGTLSLYRLGGRLTAPPLAEVAAGASTLRYAVPAGRAATLLLRATGSYAPGLTASVSTRVASGPGRSLQSVPCSAAGGDAWFVGGGASVGRRSVLFLTNIDAAPATVDIAVYTAGGMQQPTPVQGVTVRPRSQLSFALDQLVPGIPATAVHVSTRSGRVSTALSDAEVNGLQARGADWVPATSGPGLHTVVTGIPGDSDARTTLGLVVPGTDDAVVNVHLVTAQGTLSPQGLQGLSAASGKLTEVKVPAAVASGPFSVVVESDRAVVAGVRTVRSAARAGSLPDFSYGAGTTPFAGTLVLAGVAHTAALSTLLQLAAPGDSDVVVALTTTTGAVSATGRTPGLPARAPVTVRITVTAGTSVQVSLGPVGATLSTVLVQTANGAAPLYLGWVVAQTTPHGSLVTSGPLPQTPLTLVLPAVAADPAVGYSGH